MRLFQFLLKITLFRQDSFCFNKVWGGEGWLGTWLNDKRLQKRAHINHNFSSYTSFVSKNLESTLANSKVFMNYSTPKSFNGFPISSSVRCPDGWTKLNIVNLMVTRISDVLFNRLTLIRSILYVYFLMSSVTDDLKKHQSVTKKIIQNQSIEIQSKSTAKEWFVYLKVIINGIWFS